ncbi:fasciclin domain-containing protein [Seonamhaeicola sp. MEBiC1930]|uniref:fasciclin domain-containing protein n=1 Tax=Seonamhaeicola sp. MEBiC01930 TaxID=2976768 RepID=UPI00324A8984
MNMVKKIKQNKCLLLLLAFVVTFGCKPDPLEYARPDNLVGTLVPQLEGLGTFNYYLQGLKQNGYEEPLTKGGSWTLFAPTDEAFESFMAEEGYASFASIPPERVENIIKYSIIISAWNTTTLTYYDRGFYEGNSLKRRTQYQDPIVEVDAADYSLSTLVPPPEPGTYYIDTSNGRIKPVTYWLDAYFDAKPVALASDYDFIFPGKTFEEGDMKVFESHVEQTNVVAENGMIYVLDKVIEPRVNQYQNLSSEEYGGKYSTFKKLLERFGYFNYRGEQEDPETGEVFPLHYLSFHTGIVNNFLPFNPNDENYPFIKSAVDRTLANSTGLIVPTNDALQAYLDGDSVIGQFYDSYEDMPLDVLGKFLSPFFIPDFWSLCPSYFGQTYDVGLNLVDFQPEDVVDRKMCSNGFFVGVDKVYTNSSFGSAMGPVLFDPNYTIMLKSIQELGIDNALQSQGIDFSIFGIRNDQFRQVQDPNSAFRKITVLGYEPDLSVIYMLVEGDPVVSNNRVYPDPLATNPSASDISYVTTTLKDIVLNQIVEAAVDFNSDNYYQTKSGEFIYATGGNSVLGGGNISSGVSADVVEIQEGNNGKFYEMSTFIERPEHFTAGTLLDNLGAFSMFYQVLSSADALIDIPSYEEDKLINFLSPLKTYTLLAPNNNAVLQAITDGVIPDPDPDYLATLDELGLAIAKQDLLNFAKKHFIQQAIPTDGQTTGTFASLYFADVVDFIPVYDQFSVENSHSALSLTLTNVASGESVTTSGITNLLSRKVVIHELDNYIK